LPAIEAERKNFELKYYQWVPFIILMQALSFYIPHIAWCSLSRRSGIDVKDIVEAAVTYKSVEKYNERKKYMGYLLTTFDQYVDDPRRRKETRRIFILKRIFLTLFCISGKFLGNYLIILYMFIKFSFIFNCLMQIFILSYLLGHDFHSFGYNLIREVISGKYIIHILILILNNFYSNLGIMRCINF
jgi:innexin